MFTLAYLTDPHLSPLPHPTLSQLLSKRLFGYINWNANRKAIHCRPVLDALTADLLAQPFDHIAIGGDLINLSLPGEFTNALEWLQTLGAPEQVSVVPGNHDAYVPFDYASGIGLWHDYMTSHAGKAKGLNRAGELFPYVRRFGKIALVGLRSGLPAPLLEATGELGPAQRSALERNLIELGKQEVYRIVMIHHPPLPGQSRPRRGLRDAGELEEILTRNGAELVLYGHRHLQAVDYLETKSGPIPVVGTPSASSCQEEPGRLARYNLFRIWEARGRWHCEMTGRGLRAAGSPIIELEKTLLTE